MMTWTYAGSSTGFSTPGESGPLISMRELLRRHVLQRLHQVPGIEGDGHRVALELDGDLALRVADVGGRRDAHRGWALVPAEAETHDVGGRLGDERREAHGLEQLVAVDEGTRGCARWAAPTGSWGTGRR